MSNIQLFAQIWPLIPATYSLAKSVMGGVQLGAFVVSSLSDKEHLGAVFPEMLEWSNRVKATVNVITIADPVHRAAMQSFLEANDDAIELYRQLAKF